MDKLAHAVSYLRSRRIYATDPGNSFRYVPACSTSVETSISTARERLINEGHVRPYFPELFEDDHA